MSDASMLLRLLEPAVRPGGLTGGASPKPANQPIESRSFDSLLDEARDLLNDPGASGEVTALPGAGGEEETGAGTEAVNGTDAATAGESVAKKSTVSPLAGVDRIENADCRRIAGQAAKGP